jgi:hypothetical protein
MNEREQNQKNRMENKNVKKTNAAIERYAFLRFSTLWFFSQKKASAWSPDVALK